MATGRMLQKKISVSDQIDGLSNDTNRLCFTWSLAHLVYPGCFYASANALGLMSGPDETGDLTMLEVILAGGSALGYPMLPGFTGVGTATVLGYLLSTVIF